VSASEVPTDVINHSARVRSKDTEKQVLITLTLLSTGPLLLRLGNCQRDFRLSDSLKLAQVGWRIITARYGQSTGIVFCQSYSDIPWHDTSGVRGLRDSHPL
jgi:hypothetical protein